MPPCGFQNSFSVAPGQRDSVPCGLVVKHEGRTIGLPLVSVHATVQIVTLGAEVTLKQRFVNNSTKSIMTSYFFPVEENVAVYFFEANLDGKVISGVVKDKAEAKEIFEKAVEEKKTAFLVEEVDSDIMQLKVGNFNAGSECEVTLKYIQEVVNQEGRPRFTLPTTIAPRYIPFDEEDKIKDVMEQINFQYFDQKDIPMTIHVDISAKKKIGLIQSPSHTITHDIKLDKDMHYASVDLKSEVTAMDKDFVLTYEIENVEQVMCVTETHERSTALMLSLIPQLKITESNEEKFEFVFLVDCSGSMSWAGCIEKACDAMKIFIRSLPEDCYFNIYRFGSEYKKLFKSSKRYTSDSFSEASSFIKACYADLGGTELLPPLQTILSSTTIRGYSRRVFVLTDGEVSNTNKVIGLVKKNKNARVFSLGLGPNASRKLVKGIADAGQGISMFSTLQEPLHSKVMRLLGCARANSAVLEAVTLQSEKGKSVTVKPPWIYPQLPLCLLSGEKVTMFVYVESALALSNITYSGKNGSKKVKVVLNKEYLTPIEHTVIHRLVAAKIIRHQLAEKDHQQGAIDEESLRALAIKHSLVTELTSMVCVDEGGDEAIEQSAVFPSSSSCSSYKCYSRTASSCSSSGSGIGMKMYAPVYKSAAAPLPRKLRSARRSESPSRDSEVVEMAMCLNMESDMDLEEEDCDSSLSYLEDMNVRSKMTGMNLSPNEKLIRILDMCDHRGVFHDIKEFCDITGIQIIQLEDLNKENIPDEEFLTAACLAFLKTFYLQDKDTWAMIEEKAQRFLKASKFSEAVSKIEFGEVF